MIVQPFNFFIFPFQIFQWVTLVFPTFSWPSFVLVLKFLDKPLIKGLQRVKLIVLIYKSHLTLYLSFFQFWYDNLFPLYLFFFIQMIFDFCISPSHSTLRVFPSYVHPFEKIFTNSYQLMYACVLLSRQYR